MDEVIMDSTNACIKSSYVFLMRVGLVECAGEEVTNTPGQTN